MKVPAFLAPYTDGSSPTRLFQGFLLGALATLVLGFSWGEWERGTTVLEKVSAASEHATVTALAPICVDRFQLAAKSDDNLVTDLMAVNSWQRESHLKEAGWVTFPGGAEPESAVAAECATLLTAALKGQP